MRGWKVGDGVPEVRDKWTVRRHVAELGLVAVANRLRDEIHLQVVEGGSVSVLNTDSDEVDDVCDRVVIELGFVVEHVRVLGEGADARLDVDRNVDTADQLSERLPAVAIVNQNGVEPGSERVQRHCAEADGFS